MKAPPFRYVRADSLDSALALLAEHGDDAQVLAGGQSLMPALNLRLAAPRLLVDINGLAGLTGISLAGDHLRIGALTRHAEVLASPLVREHAPLIAAAMPNVAHPAVRNRGTFGGSVAYADPAAEMPACVLALGATLVLQSRDGRREVAADDFFQGLYTTERRPDEILVEALIPRRPAARIAFDEVAKRHGDFAIVGLAGVGELDGATVRSLRLVYFGCEDRPKLAASAAAAAVGRALDAVTIDAIATALQDDLDPVGNLLGSAATKRYLAGALTRRALGRWIG